MSTVLYDSVGQQYRIYIEPNARISWQEAGAKLNGFAQVELSEGLAKDYSAAFRLATQEHPDLAAVYAGLSLVTGNPAYSPPKFDDAHAEVDKRVRARIFAEGLDPVKDYAKALQAVLTADPELKTAYARS